MIIVYNQMGFDSENFQGIALQRFTDKPEKGMPLCAVDVNCIDRAGQRRDVHISTDTVNEAVTTYLSIIQQLAIAGGNPKTFEELAGMQSHLTALLAFPTDSALPEADVEREGDGGSGDAGDSEE